MGEFVAPRIGIDLAEVPRVRALVQEHGERFLCKVFTPTERAIVLTKKSKPVDRAEHWAARFAGKEAAMKALGVGLAQGITWHDVEFLQDDFGAPVLVLHGAAARIAKRLGVAFWSASLSHTHGLAVAVVVGV